MNEQLVQRVKISLNKQFYCMNDSWLHDCIEYFFQDNQNPTQEEIITFVKNQWQLSDLREINNENGSLPNNISNTKCITLPGRYILQMEKIYDISISKYKQLEKIRQVSSENVETTENENTNQEDKFQAWEPKSKRMLHLFLTDGIQNITAIEYKPIRFLKDTLFPGYKLLIKGPVTCRKGVLLLEENNIAEIGGEVDSLLVVNAVENIFARALNLQENPDPYNDIHYQVQSDKNSEVANLMEDDFDLDSQSIAQIEKQLQQQNSNSNRNSNTSAKNNVTAHRVNPANLYGSNQTAVPKETINFEDDDDSFLEMVDERAFQDIPTSKTSVQQKRSVNKPSCTSHIVPSQNEDNFPTEDELNELEQSPFFTTSKSQNQMSSKNNLVCSPKTSSKVSTSSHSVFPNRESRHKNDVSNTVKESPTKNSSCTNSMIKSPSSSSSRNTTKSLEQINKNTFSSNTRESPKKKDDHKNSLFKFPSSPLKSKNIIKSSEQKQKNTSSNSSTKSPKKNDTYSSSSCYKSTSSSNFKVSGKPSTSHTHDFPDEDFDISTDFSENFGKNCQNDALNEKTNPKTLFKSSNSTFSPSKKKGRDNLSRSEFRGNNSSELLETQFGDEFNEEFDPKMEVDNSIQNMKQKSHVVQKLNYETSDKTSTSFESRMHVDFPSEQTGVKRLASIRSPIIDTRHKKSCTHSTPVHSTKRDNISEAEMKEFIDNLTKIDENTLVMMELLSDVLKRPLSDEGTRTIVRGIVTNIVKLNLLKKDDKSYFHLEGRITDYTEELDVVFSPEVLEKIIGMTTLEFSQKRREGRTNPTVKDQLRNTLKKAEEVLRNLDVMMELEIKKNEKAVILFYTELTDSHKKVFDEKVKKYMKQKFKR